MAKTSPELIDAIYRTIRNLKNGNPYQWGHMGSCNCGHLAQELTQYSKAEIHAFAMERYGDWNKQVMDYCPDSGFAIDDLISILLKAGLTREDLQNLEKLSDKKILERIPSEKRMLRCNQRDDVIIYLAAWARLLEYELIKGIKLKDLDTDSHPIVKRTAASY